MVRRHHPGIFSFLVMKGFTPKLDSNKILSYKPSASHKYKEKVRLIQ